MSAREESAPEQRESQQRAVYKHTNANAQLTQPPLRDLSYNTVQPVAHQEAPDNVAVPPPPPQKPTQSHTTQGSLHVTGATKAPLLSPASYGIPLPVMEGSTPPSRSNSDSVSDIDGRLQWYGQDNPIESPQRQSSTESTSSHGGRQLYPRATPQGPATAHSLPSANHRSLVPPTTQQARNQMTESSSVPQQTVVSPQNVSHAQMQHSSSLAPAPPTRPIPQSHMLQHENVPVVHQQPQPQQQQVQRGPAIQSQASVTQRYAQPAPPRSQYVPAPHTIHTVSTPQQRQGSQETPAPKEVLQPQSTSLLMQQAHSEHGTAQGPPLPQRTMSSQGITPYGADHPSAPITTQTASHGSPQTHSLAQVHAQPQHKQALPPRPHVQVQSQIPDSTAAHEAPLAGYPKMTHASDPTLPSHPNKTPSQVHLFQQYQQQQATKQFASDQTQVPHEMQMGMSTKENASFPEHLQSPQPPAATPVPSFAIHIPVTNQPPSTPIDIPTNTQVRVPALEPQSSAQMISQGVSPESGLPTAISPSYEFTHEIGSDKPQSGRLFVIRQGHVRTPSGMSPEARDIPQRELPPSPPPEQPQVPQNGTEFTSSAAAYLAGIEYSSSESDDSGDEGIPPQTQPQGPIDSLPEYTSASRRAPLLEPPRSAQFKSTVYAADLFGDIHAFGTGDKIRVITYNTENRESSEYVLPQTAEHYAALKSPATLTPTSKELRATTLAFAPPLLHASDSVSTPVAENPRYLWYGTANGQLAEVDISSGSISALRPNIHTGSILMLTRVGRSMVCLDETGKISAWVPNDDEPLSLANSQPRTQRITLPKNCYANMIMHQLWICTMAPVPKSSPMQTPVRMLNVRVYNPISDDRPFNAVSRPLTLPPHLAAGVGSVTSSAVLPALTDCLLLGHESGHISVWSLTQYTCVDVQHVFSTAITSMAAVHTLLWFGTRDGFIRVFSMEGQDLVEVKGWHAHRDAVLFLRKDRYGFRSTPGLLQIMSIGADNAALVWDAMLSEEWIQSELQKRASQFCTYRLARVLQLTYNIDAATTSSMFGAVENMEVFQRILRSACNGPTGPEYVDPNASPDVIVFSLQEVVALDDTRLNAKRFFLGKKKRGGTDFDDRVSSQYRAWYDKLVGVVRVVMPPEAQYTVLHSENLVGLFSIVFVKTSLLPHIRDASTYTIKTGLGGRYGNKGAIVSRLILDDSSMCFLNCHLAAGQRNVRQRNADVRDVS